MMIVIKTYDDYDAEYVAGGFGAFDFAVGAFAEAEALGNGQVEVFGDAEAFEKADEFHIYLLLTRSFTPSSRPIL